MYKKTDLFELVAEVLGIPLEKISIETERDKCEEWDSFAHIHLIIEIEERYGVSIPIEKVPEIHTVGDIYEYMKA